MDLSEEAAPQLTKIFERIGVPCRASYTSEKGKHIIATADIPGKTDLFEEMPIVSWPAQGYVALGIPFCFYCLRQQGKLDSTKSDGEAILWRTCDSCGSFFCSTSCESSSKTFHSILCNALPELRKNKDSGLSGVDSRCIFSKPITEESLARCVASVVARIANSIKQQHFSGEFLETDSVHNSRSVITQLFNFSCASFNRLVDAPKGIEFADIDAGLFYRTVGLLLREPCRFALVSAAAEPQATSDCWALEIVDALLRHDTLETFLGQLALNSQAINGLILSSSLGKEDSTVVLPWKWLLKGGGVYTLQSAFNHSCDPNMVVASVDGTHEIKLTTLRPVKKGEELTITYIPLENTTCEERQAKLRAYFFTCSCQRCKEESENKDL